MPNIPGQYPFPYMPAMEIIIGNEKGSVITDAYSHTFKVQGNKHAAALAMLERGFQFNTRPGDFNQRIGPIYYVFKDHRLIEIRYYFAEKRQEIIEFVQIMNAQLKMKVFL